MIRKKGEQMKKIKVKILVTSSGIYGSFVQGQNADISEDCANDFFKCGYAEPLGKADKKAEVQAEKKVKAKKKNK